MASGSSSSGGSGPRRRGLFSCLHSFNCRGSDAPLLPKKDLPQATEDAPPLPDQDLPRAICKLIVGFYEEAFDRLPTESDTMPDLLGLLNAGGLCLGLLDPVSNIILNTITLLPKDGTTTASSSSSSPAAKRPSPGTDAWIDIATRSYLSLLGFLVTYFGCLTKVQAIRYVYRAEANLLLAVKLVQHDLYYPDSVDTESGRMQAALDWAATIVGHPSPRTLTRLMSTRLEKGDFGLLGKQFAGDATGSPLTAEEVREIHRLVHRMMRPMFLVQISHNTEGLGFHVCRNSNVTWSPSPSTTSDGWIVDSAFLTQAGTPISSVQFGLPDKLKDCLTIADGQIHILKTPCGDACDYVKSLEMVLHGMIHNMYVKAFMLLPTPPGSLVRSILKAGHCYGSCDPLSNIIINSIWYDTCTPVPDRSKFANYNDILDPRSLLRLVVRSLNGLVKLALLSDPQSSIACAMEKLCSAKCVVTDMLSSAKEMTQKNHLHMVAEAAGHPAPLQLAELHRQLRRMPDKRRELLSWIDRAQTSGCVLDVDRIRGFLTCSSFDKCKPKTTVRAPKLCEHALGVVSNRISEYEKRRSWFRSKIEQVLQDYTDEHSYGPKYTLDIIFGVEESNQDHPPYVDMRYRINFLATSDLKLQRTLFFAEVWASPKPEAAEFCCPLPYAYAGRCYYDEHTARKIVYPDDAKYFSDDITSGGTLYVDGMREMDLVYFSSKLDVELAENLNMLPSSEFDPDEFE